MATGRATPENYDRLNINLPKTDMQYLKESASELDLSLTDQVRRCIRVEKYITQTISKGGSVWVHPEDEEPFMIIIV